MILSFSFVGKIETRNTHLRLPVYELNIKNLSKILTTLYIL